MSGGEQSRERAKKRALNALNARAMSRGEMRERLIKLGETDEVAEEVAGWLEETGIIDDLEYARGIARSFTRRGYGERRVRDEFYKRRVPRELWDDVLSEYFDDDGGAPDAAVTLIERRVGGETPDWAERKRVSDALVRRGFSWDEINAAWAVYLEGLA